MDNKRLDRWLAGSKRVQPLDAWLGFVTANLGRLDCSLIDLDRRVENEREPLGKVGYSYSTTDTLALSYLWVLGAYELVRVLDQRVREGDSFCSKHFPAIRSIKHEFERIRIPLAKLEPSRK